MTVAVAEQRTMAKSKGRPPGDRDDVPVRLDRKLASKARQIAAAQGVPIAEYLSGITFATINRDFAKVLREADEAGGEK